MELPVLSFSSLQTCRSTGCGRFYLFEPIDSQKAFSIRQVLLGRKPKRRDVLVASVFKFEVVLFLGYRISGGGLILAAGIVGFQGLFKRCRAKRKSVTAKDNIIFPTM